MAEPLKTRLFVALLGPAIEQDEITGVERRAPPVGGGPRSPT
jgi:hypothetical protein